MNRNELKNLLSQNYNYDNWLNVYRYLFAKAEFFAVPSLIEFNNTEKVKIEQFRQIGYVSLKDDSQIALFEVKVAPDVPIARNRVYLNNVISRWIAAGGLYSAAIGIFYSDKQPDYRFTFAMRGARFTGDMKLEEIRTNPKRYTYVLGENEKCETASRRFETLNGRGFALSLSDVEDAFSVEKLNKEFFRKVSESFYELVGGKVEKKSFDHLLSLPSVDYEKDKKKYQQFAVRLIGRIVFCWFLKFKKSEAGKKPLIPEALLSLKAVEDNPGYYHAVLEKLFFECLNMPKEQRRPNILEGAESIPFLNGGLFEAHHDDYYELQNIAEHYQSEYFSTLQIPDKWFLTFFETLEQYNFTIDENSIFDADVSVDPEILGRIFENLLAEINPETGETARKSTGSYYTPREIVDYMVEQSLIETLKIKTALDAERLQRLFSYEEQILYDKDKVQFSTAEKKKISNALHDIKALDPACGSGAFPMGILHKMLYALSQVDPDSQLWYEQQIADIKDYKLRDNLKAKFKDENVPYIHKLGIINHCVYGVDIQPIAVEISKLRFFLSLVVDEKVNDRAHNRGVKPLPNLDFKFVAANSLIPAPGNHGKTENSDELELDIPQVVQTNFDFNDIDPFFDKFAELAEMYFYAEVKEKKTKVREELENLVKDKVYEKEKDINEILTVYVKNSEFFSRSLEKTYHEKLEKLHREQQLWESYLNIFKGEAVGFFEIQYFFPKAKHGFDIVIGNPPYGLLNKKQNKAESIIVSDEDFKYYKSSEYYQPATGGMINIFRLFILRSIRLLSPNGVFSEIFPLAFIGDQSISKLRKYIFANCQVLFVEAFPERDNENKRVFEAVKMSVCILSLKRAVSEDQFFIRINDDRFINNKAIKNFLDSKQIKILDEEYMTFPLTLPTETDILKRIFLRSKRFSQIGKCNTGEIDMTFYKESFSTDCNNAVLLKGAIIDRYLLRKKMSQGEIVYIDENKLLKVKNISKDFKKQERIVLQGITGVNEKTRLKMMIVENAYCANSLNYLSVNEKLDKRYLLGLFNCKLLNFVFSKFSTNSNVNGYEVDNLPICLDHKFEPVISKIVQFILLIKKENCDSCFFESIIDSLVYELYFPEEINGAASDILKHLINLPELKNEWSDEKKMEIIEDVYQKLSNSKHPVSIAMERQKMVNEVRIIEGIECSKKAGSKMAEDKGITLIRG